ncbi:MAG: GWxTD domain-containing protein, partial [Bacteroidales bacterium]
GLYHKDLFPVFYEHVRSSYYLQILKNNTPIFDDFAIEHDTVSIIHTWKKTLKYNYFSDTTTIALPPNVISFPKRKSNTPYIANTYNSDTLICKRGYYEFFIPNDSSKYVLYVGDSLFPKLKYPYQLLEPMKYLLPQLNADSLATSKLGAKKEVDKLWLSFTNNNTTKARELIRVYFNRVQLANIFFTSYKEGWKTDKGMIYIVLGLPTYINFENNKETWIYKSTHNKQSVEFIFTQNCYNHKNDMILDRKSQYYSLWNKAIQTWKSGEVFVY